jgi:hypothetical protein
VNDVRRWQPISPSQLGVADLAPRKKTALAQQLGARGAVDCPVDATPAKERRVRRVDDRIHREGGDVSSDRTNCRRHDGAG